jgi:uncharacterized protein YndB with AHSA1/START domain
MTEPNVAHGVFTVERTYDASPARVFAAWSSAEARAQWFFGPEGWVAEIREVDFRVGGHERTRGRFPDGHTSDFQATYHDLVPDRRIVFVYDMYLNTTKISVSLATVTIAPAGAGTRLTVTEQGVFLDGYDDAGGREHGTALLLEHLAAALERQTA